MLVIRSKHAGVPPILSSSKPCCSLSLVRPLRLLGSILSLFCVALVVGRSLVLAVSFSVFRVFGCCQIFVLRSERSMVAGCGGNEVRNSFQLKK